MKDFNSLAKEHNGFVAPDYAILIDKTDLKEKFTIEDLKLELTAQYEASSCTFKIKSAYVGDKDFKVKMSDDAAKLIKLGNIAEVSIGYGSAEKTPMFMGYIDSIYIDYGESNDIDLTVECLDAKGVMMHSRRSELKKDIKKYDEAVKNVFSAYSKLITKQTVDTAYEASVIEQHNESDYEFVVRLAKQINYSFYIINGEVFFRSNSKSKKVVLKVVKSDLVNSFSLHMSMRELASEVCVRSKIENKNGEIFEGKATSYKNAVDGSDVSVEKGLIVSAKGKKTIIDHSVASNDDANLLAEAALTQMSYFLMDGKLECIGVPGLFPGDALVLEGFGEHCDRSYYISKATHSIDDNGYITECELGANKL